MNMAYVLKYHTTLHYIHRYTCIIIIDHIKVYYRLKGNLHPYKYVGRTFRSNISALKSGALIDVTPPPECL